MELTGAEIFVRCLQDEGVEVVFGYPGGAVLHIYDAFDQQKKVRHVLTRHEQGAVHGAEGYAKSTNKPGVALVTSGPGATNAVTGIADAYLDSVPLVVFTGQVPTSLIGNDAFQEVDMVGITRPCVKHNFLVKDVADLAETIKKAFYIATTGRPGPVVVDIPKDVTAEKAEYHYPDSVEMRSYKPNVMTSEPALKAAADLILASEKPILYTGGGVVLGNGAPALYDLAKYTGFPVTNTLMGLGGYPATDEQFVGMLGMHGTYEANMAMHKADLVVAIGARFDDRVTGNIEKFCPDAKIIHLDIDPSSISKNVKVDVPLVGEVVPVLEGLLAELKSRDEQVNAAALKPWWSLINEWRSMNCLAYQENEGKIRPQRAIETLWEVTNGDAYVASDVGQHQMWAAQYYKFDKPLRWLNSGGLGTMGFGLPAAMGAQIAHPDATVACVTGEGSIQMCIQELSTCLQYGLPVKIICLNNGFLGMVRQWQEFFYQGRYSMSYMESLPDFVKLAEAYGHVGIQVDDPAKLKDSMEECFSLKDRLVFMNILTDRETNVYPMIPAGAGQNEMILV